MKGVIMVKRCPNCGCYKKKGRWIKPEQARKEIIVINEVCIGCLAFYRNVRKEKRK